MVLVFRDVTERRLAEEALRASEENYRVLAEKLHEVDGRKNEFMAVLSHELRNPLAAICNSLSLLKQKSGIRAWEIIERQIGQLTRLVDDLLDITRITQGKIQLQLQRLELNELVQKTVEDHRPLFEIKGVHLAVDIAPSAVFVNADQARLVQVVGNLLQNAAKFTDCGGRTRVSVKSDPRKSQAVIRVADTGVGIAPELFPRLFTPFMQADTSLDRSRGGLGLGLALCKGLLELHGGDIDAYSSGTGRGAEFVIHLPLAKSALREQHRAPAAAPGRRRRVLIVDDNVDLADSLRELLELNDHEVAVAYTGLEGIDRAREFRPEILLCDIGLPGMNGYDVARTFREDEELRHIYLVALTGYALPDDLQRASAAGFSCHLAKPVDLTELMQLLDRLPDRCNVLPVTR